MARTQLSAIKKQFIESITIDALREKIIEKRGNLSAVARALKITRKTVYSKIQDHPELVESVIEGRETSLDDAEQGLDDLVKQGNVAAIIFKLKTQGKSRGYVERQENIDITLDLNKLNDEQLSRLAAGEDFRSILAIESASGTGTA